MRRKLSCILLIALLLCGCSDNNNASNQINIYYYSTNALYDQSDSVFYSRQIEVDLTTLTPEHVISTFISEPMPQDNEMPFPKGTSVVSLKQEDDTLQIRLSDHCAEMQELELSLSASCLARTLFQIVTVDSISISAENGFEYAEETMVFTRNNILTTDDYIPAG